MLSRFSVKKPYFIVVAVIIILILGGVSLSRMKTDLLPEMDLPYLAVITTDPGANAEKVEREVTDPIESAVSTVSGVKSVQSMSSDNFSMVFLEFEDGTDMDSAMVKVSSAANQVIPMLPEVAGQPNLLEISADMMATLYIACSYDDHDIYQTTQFVQDEVVPAIERVDGVADVSTNGAVAKSIEVRLSDSKIEDVNNRLLANVNGELYDAKKQIDAGYAALGEAEAEIDRQQAGLDAKQKETFDGVGQGSSGLTAAISAQISKISAMQAQIQALQAQWEAAPEDQKPIIQAQIDALKAEVEGAQQTLQQLQGQLAQVESGGLSASSGFGSASAQLAAAKATISANRADLDSAQKQYEEARESALAQANIDSLVDKPTLSQILVAQNFAMPAGYVDDANDGQWLLRVGDEISSVEELENLVLADIDGLGPIRLNDVADVTVIDNVGDSYLKIDGQDGVLLSVFKSSTASTSEVSDEVAEQIERLESQNEGLHLKVMSDQGSFIDLYIETILRSLLLGAVLAVVVLALFLRDWKPTIIVAFSIPFSVLCAIVLLYFSDIALNVMSLGGISLAVGMLVDNSIVVLENIYRLRGRGVSAPRAAVQGAKQISGAVVASTLTTICVFVPIVFTTGLVNQLMMPFALTLAYVLCASLVVALTLVPTISSVVFRSYRPKRLGWMEALQDKYATTLSFFLRHKAIPLLVSVALLFVAVGAALKSGIILMPSMSSDTLQVQVNMPEGTEREDAFAMADEVMAEAMDIEGVKMVSAMDGTSSVSLVSSDASGSFGDQLVEFFTFFVQIDPEVVKSESDLREVQNELAARTEGMPCEVIADAMSSDSMSSMMGSGLSITLTGKDAEGLLALSEEVMAAVDGVEGYVEIDNGMEDAADELHLVVDREKLAKQGYTVAQLYADLSALLSTTVDSTNLTLDGSKLGVAIVDERSQVTKENILDTELEIVAADGSTKTVKLGEFCTLEESKASTTISHINGSRVMTVTAEVEEGYNNALLSRELTGALDAIDVPEGYSIRYGGELENIDKMLVQMAQLLLLGFALIYLIMVAQFQSLLSPFIVIFTVPLAFTGGFLGLLAMGEQVSMLSLMGFAVLMGTVVNNGIVFVDYVNQLRIGGLQKRDALIAAGRTRMRPIMMTAMTTILAMLPMVFSQAIGSSMERGMAIVVAAGLLYATLMTLFVVPVVYDILYRKTPREVDLGDESVDDGINDAEEYLAMLASKAAVADNNSANLQPEDFDDPRMSARAARRAAHAKKREDKRAAKEERARRKAERRGK